jgi:hypothetical protein
MTEPLTRADHYRKEAAKYHELAKFARPAYLGDFYRRIASRYLVMAEDVLRCRNEEVRSKAARNKIARRTDAGMST